MNGRKHERGRALLILSPISATTPSLGSLAEPTPHYPAKTRNPPSLPAERRGPDSLLPPAETFPISAADVDTKYRGREHSMPASRLHSPPATPKRSVVSLGVGRYGIATRKEHCDGNRLQARQTGTPKRSRVWLKGRCELANKQEAKA